MWVWKIGMQGRQARHPGKAGRQHTACRQAGWHPPVSLAGWLAPLQIMKQVVLDYMVPVASHRPDLTG